MTAEGAYHRFEQIAVEVRDKVAHVTLRNPPVNVVGAKLCADLRRAADLLDADEGVRVAVFRSGVPDFFAAHIDIELCTDFPDGVPYEQTGLAWFQQAVARVRRMRKATIGLLEGRARGADSELLLALDLRYAAIGRAVLAQPEIGFNLLPGGGGTQRLTRLVGRSRALEVMLTGDDVSPERAELYGYVNRAVPADRIVEFVEGVARRIAHFPPEAVRRVKECVDLAEPPLDQGLAREADLFFEAVRDETTVRAMAGFMAAQGQTPATELDLAHGLVPDEVATVRVGMADPFPPTGGGSSAAEAASAQATKGPAHGGPRTVLPDGG